MDRTYNIPSNTDRSGTRGRPPGDLRGGGGGINGSASAHNSSLTSRHGGEELRFGIPAWSAPTADHHGRTHRSETTGPTSLLALGSHPPTGLSAWQSAGMTEIDSTTAQGILDEARQAHAAASAALRRAEQIAAAAGLPGNTDTNTVTAQRIDIVEPDGTPRLIITSAARLPGGIARGEEFPHPGRTDLAGVLFFNDEGTETGGLLFAGKEGEGGAHLSFDNYEQDQVIVLDSHDAGPDARTVQLEFWDRPNWSMYDVVAAEAAGDPDAFDKAIAEEGGATRRLRLAREQDTSIGLTMSDSQGRARIVLKVSDDDAYVRVLDADGDTVAQLPSAE